MADLCVTVVWSRGASTQHGAGSHDSHHTATPATGKAAGYRPTDRPFLSVQIIPKFLLENVDEFPDLNTFVLKAALCDIPGSIWSNAKTFCL